MTDLDAAREAVAKVEAAVPYACNGEDHRTVMARIRGGEEAKRVLLAAIPALLDEVEALRQHHAEAVEAAYREGFYEGMTSSYQADRKYAYSDVNGWWLASKAKRELEGSRD